ncbi:MAG: hypothetical protein AB8B36_14225, partial [Prochlorococcus sp.]
FYAAEEAFSQDFNGDERKGNPFNTIEREGSVKLLKSRVSLAAFARLGQDEPIAITNWDESALATNPSENIGMIAADIVNDKNQIIYQQGNDLSIWTLDQDWSYTGESQDIDFGSEAYYQAEIDFDQDFDADERIGREFTEIESVGENSLYENRSGLAFIGDGALSGASSVNDLVSLTDGTSGNTPVETGLNSPTSTWNLRAAERIDGKNSLVSSHASDGSILIAQANRNWRIGSNTRTVQNYTAEFYAAEENFGIDLNSDEEVGDPFTTLENAGSVTLLKTDDGSAYSDTEATDPVAIQNLDGNAVNVGDDTTSQQIIGIETFDGVNSIAWKDNTSGDITVWQADSNWAFNGNSVGYSFESDDYYQAEVNFQQDFNGDNARGRIYTAIESEGEVSLFRDQANGAVTAAINGDNYTTVRDETGPLLITAGEWQVVGAETINSVNTIVKTTTDANGNISIQLSAADASWLIGDERRIVANHLLDFHQAESDFNLDLNGDTVIGNPFQFIEISGTVSLMKTNASGFAYANSSQQQVTDPTPLKSLSGSQLNVGDDSTRLRMVGIDTVDGENRIVWRGNGANLTVWKADANWQFTGESTEIAYNPGGATADTEGYHYYQTEIYLQQDLNGDGAIGRMYTQMENQGTFSLFRHEATNQAAVTGPGVETGVWLTDVSTGDSPVPISSGGWDIVSVEAVGGVNTV